MNPQSPKQEGVNDMPPCSNYELVISASEYIFNFFFAEMTHIHEANDTCKEAPLFSFGILADVQYADIDDKIDFKKTAWRHYRKSITNLEDAINKWNSMSYPVSFLLHLGDIIDGFNRRINSSQEALNTIVQILAKFKGSHGVHHTMGNHELYNFSRATLLKGPLNSNPNREENSLYYSFSPHQGFRIIVLDTFDISFIGGDEDSPGYQEAVAMLADVNPTGDQDKAHMLSGVDQRFSVINGGVGKVQMSWLNDTLTTADQRGEHVIVIGGCSYHF